MAGGTICAAGMGVLGACAGDSNQSRSRGSLEVATLRISWVPNGEYAMYYLAQEKGFFSDEGIEIRILPGQGSATTIQTVDNGADMFGIAEGGSLMLA